MRRGTTCSSAAPDSIRGTVIAFADASGRRPSKRRRGVGLDRRGGRVGQVGGGPDALLDDGCGRHLQPPEPHRIEQFTLLEKVTLDGGRQVDFLAGDMLLGEPPQVWHEARGEAVATLQAEPVAATEAGVLQAAVRPA